MKSAKSGIWWLLVKIEDPVTDRTKRVMPNQNTTSYDGECFCGAVKVRATGAPFAMGYCHCNDCRAWSAAPATSYTLWQRDAVEVIEGADMLFITAGMGGGTGTGATPVVAQVAKELGILTVAVVTRPFDMEGGKRMMVADNGISELGKFVDSLITIPNEKLLSVLGPQTTLLDAFRAANQVLQGAVQGIAELITRPGLINVDFADVRTVMAEMGMAMMGSGQSSGEDRARDAAEAAVSSPLLEDINLAGANGILVNVTAGMDLSIGEFQEVGATVKEFASGNATVVVGTVIDPEMTDQIRVTVVATGLGQEAQQQMPSPMRVIRRQPEAQAPNYNTLEKPTVQRQRAVGDGLEDVGTQEELLDIPAFLRRQAD